MFVCLFVSVEILLIWGMVDMLQLPSILWLSICEWEPTAHPSKLCSKGVWGEAG